MKQKAIDDEREERAKERERGGRKEGWLIERKVLVPKKAPFVTSSFLQVGYGLRI